MAKTKAKAQPAPIHINLLGEFSIYVEGWSKDSQRVDDLRRSNRLWSLIAYLAVNRDVLHSNESLIRIFWPDYEEHNDPLRALWLAISRARKALEDLGIPEARNLIISTNGGYRWNPLRPTVIDAEEFEKLAELRNAAVEDRLDRTLEALSLYGGEFWCRGIGTVWATPRQLYYKTLFLQLCQEAVDSLWPQERWQEIADICAKAAASEPGNEGFSVYYMRALINLGQPQKALEHYEHIKSILKKEYMVELSSELELARSEAASITVGQNLSAVTVAEHLKVEESEGAFYCDYTTFRKIVELELRATRRSGKSFQIVLLDINSEDQASSSATDMKRMERALLANLRMGDPFTRLAATQYLILLPNAEPQNVKTVMERVENTYTRDSGRTESNVTYHIVGLDEFLGLGH